VQPARHPSPWLIRTFDLPTLPTSLDKRNVKYWERRRIVFNFVLLAASWAGWSLSNGFNVGVDQIHGARITDPGVVWRLVVVFVIYNIAFSIGYVIDVAFGENRRSSLVLRMLRPAFVVMLCLVSMWFISGNVATIAQHSAYSKAGMPDGTWSK
jgi:hypothetical protein